MAVTEVVQYAVYTDNENTCIGLITPIREDNRRVHSTVIAWQGDVYLATDSTFSRPEKNIILTDNDLDNLVRRMGVVYNTAVEQNS